MPSAGITLAAEPGHLPALQSWLQDRWTDAALPPDLAFPFELALEEVFMNVVMHGATPGGPVPQVHCELACSDDHVDLLIEDEGRPFDPLQRDAPDLEAALEDRPVGGLGIHLIRQMMDDVRYEHTGRCNRLTMRKHRG